MLCFMGQTEQVIDYPFLLDLVSMKNLSSERGSTLETDEIISHEIEAKETVYEYRYTPELMDSLLEQSVEESEQEHLKFGSRYTN